MSGPSWDETVPVQPVAPPVETVKPGSAPLPTWDETQDIQEKYGGVGGQIAAAGLGALDTMTLGAGNALLGGANVQKGLREANPVASTVGEVGGFGLSHLYGVGEAEDLIRAAKAGVKAAKATGSAAEIAKAAEGLSAVKNTVGLGDLLNPVKGISKLGGKVSTSLGEGVLGTAAGAATEGALFGAGATLSEKALGDPDANAERLMHNVGYGTLIGGGLGGSLGLISKGISKLPEMLGSASKTVKDASTYVDQILAETPKNEIPIVDGMVPKGIKKTSIMDMQSKVAEGLAKGETIELPQKQVLIDAEAALGDMKYPVHSLQAESLDNQEARNLYRVGKEMPGETGNTVRSYEALQKNERLAATDQAIKDIAPGYEPKANAVRGGEHAIEAFTENYKAEQEALKPTLKAIKGIETENPFGHVEGVIKSFTDTNPGIARMFDTTGTSDWVKINPYSTSWGIEKATYNAVKQAVDALKEPATLEHLMNIRMGLEQNIDLMAGGKAASQIRGLKANMLEYIQKEIEKVDPFISVARRGGDQSAHVRSVLKDWAINEQQREVIEHVFGASVGSKEFGQISKIKPELILDKIFSNTATVKAAKAILGPEKFAEVLANHLAEKRMLATKDKAFSSNKFWTFLRTNQDALNEAFENHGAARSRIKNLNTTMRLLPDEVSINPSGTAKTLMGSLTLSPGKLLDNLKEYGAEKWQKHQAIGQINEALAGTASKAETLQAVDKAAKQSASKISSGIKSIFNAAEKGAGFTASKLIPEDRARDHKKLAQQVNELSANPSLMLDKLTKATEHLYAAAPDTAAGIHQAAIRATQFLASKVPQSPVSSPLEHPIEPSNSELAKFDRYHEIVENPISILKQVKNNTLSSEAMEAMGVVYPKMLAEMREGIYSHMTVMKNAKAMPYQTKLAVSMFMGAPLDRSMSQESIAASQATYAQASAQEQADQKMIQPTSKGMGKVTLANRTTLHPNDEA